MLKTKFEAQQYVIRQAEIKLNNDTQMLLTEMLRSLSEDKLELIEDYNLDYEYSNYITDIIISNNSIILKTKDFEGHRHSINIDSLTQIKQKELIDFILENNLVSNF